MSKQTATVICGMLAILLSSAANAVTVQGTFTGTVTSSNDMTGYFGLGIGNVLNGMIITGTFSYEVNQAGPDVYPNIDTFGVAGDYQGTNFDWINASITVAGFTESTHDAGTGNAEWDTAILGPTFDATDVLMVRDATQNPASSVSDSFFVRSLDTCNGCSYNGPNQLNIIWGEQFTLNITEFLDDSMIVGDGAMQTFSWTDDPASPDSASGSFTVNHQVRGFNDSGIYSLLLNEQYGINFSVHSVDATISAVPVPAAVWLFASGIAGLLGLARGGRSRGS